MTPVKALLPLAKGFLRFGVLIFAFIYYTKTFTRFHVTDINWLISAFFLVFALLLFVGSFSNSAAWSIIPGFIIFGLSVFELVRGFKGMDTHLSIFLFNAAIGLYFVARGNKG